jgi:hypothetical protein
MYRTPGAVIKYITIFLYVRAPVKATRNMFLGWRGRGGRPQCRERRPGLLQMIGRH